MHINDIVEYTDWRGDKHDAKVTKVMEQPTNIEETQHTELINVEYQVKGRVRMAELVSKKPNAGGECYGKVIKEVGTPEEDAKKEDSEPEPSDEDIEKAKEEKAKAEAEAEAKPDTESAEKADTGSTG